MQFQIENTRRAKPLKVVIYGPEGIGKTTFASQFPDPVFIDTDNEGTSFIDAKKLPDPTNWSMLMQEVQFAATNKPGKTLVLDTADWAETLAKRYLMQKNHWKAIDSANYGAKYVALADEIQKLLQALNQVVTAGMNVVITAHAQLKKQELPDEIGAFDRWELKLERRDSAMIKEWADLLLFADYKTTVVTDSNNHAKAQGGERVVYTTHKPTWDAKNRLGLADQLPFKYEAIKAPLEKAMGISQEPGNGEVPEEVLIKMINSQLQLQDLANILYQGNFVANGTPMSQVPQKVWSYINENWQDAVNFYNTKIKK